MKTGADKKTLRKLYELLGTLSVEFILGVILTTVIEYDPHSTSLAQKIILGLHIFFGAYLLIISTLFVIRSVKLRLLVGGAWLGLISVIVAFGSGSIASRSGNDWATFIMALSFLAAFLSYFVILTRLKNQNS